MSASAKVLLEGLAAEIRACRKCPLWANRRRAVPGEGPPHAKIMIVGQSPGRREDTAGRPFVGPAGKCLDKAMKAAGLVREKAFVTSVLKSYLPSGARVKREYVAACFPYLLRQMDLIKPEFILLLGAVATGCVLGVKELEKARGKWFQARGARCMPTYHPAAAMRFPKLAAVMDRDFRRFAREARPA